MPPRKRTRKPRDVYDPNATMLGTDAELIAAEVEAENEAAEVRAQAREQRGKRPSRTEDARQRAAELAALTTADAVEVVEHGEDLFVIRFPVYVDPALGTVNRRYTVSQGRIFPSLEAFEFAETIARAVPSSLHHLCWSGPCAFAFVWYRSAVHRSGEAAPFHLPLADTDGPIKSTVDVFAPPKKAKRPLAAVSLIADDDWMVDVSAKKAPTHGRPRMDVSIILAKTIADAFRLHHEESAMRSAQALQAITDYVRDRDEAARVKKEERRARARDTRARREHAASEALTPFAVD